MILLTGWEISLVIQAFWKTIWSCTETHIQLLAEDHDNCVNMCQDFLKRWNVIQKTQSRILWHTNHGHKYLQNHGSSHYTPLRVANQTCDMETAEWQWRAEPRRFLWPWHFLKHVEMYVFCTLIHITQNMCSDNTRCLKIWIKMDTKKYNWPPLQPLLQGMI